MKCLVDDFKLYSKDRGVSASVFDDVVKKTENALTPVVLEERKMNVVGMDIYSRLLYDRILYFGENFTSETCNLAIAQLLYLNSLDEREIMLYINSSGGSVIDGLGVIDTINFINSPVSTTCIGMAASMGAVLLSCGKIGSRFVLPHSRVMIHQVSSGMKGCVSDMKIEFEQAERCKNDVYNILAKNLNKDYSEIESLCDRDNWFIGEEAVKLGIADKVLIK